MKTTLLTGVVALAALHGHSADGRDVDPKRRTAVILDFTATVDDRPASRDRSSVSSAMVSDFTSISSERPSYSSPGSQTIPGQANPSFVRTPAIEVPRWMRGERGLLALQSMPTSLPTIGDCGARNE